MEQEKGREDKNVTGGGRAGVAHSHQWSYCINISIFPKGKYVLLII